MDFFKSVFSDEPDPSDLQKDPKSPNKQDNLESTFSDTDTDTDTDPNPNPNPSSESSWNFGGLIKTLATKSETVIQTYRRDLEEFGSGLKKETAIIREAASRAVKELPASIEVGASAAQESIESVGQVIDEFGSSVWRGTAEIITSSTKEGILSSDLENDSFDNQFSRNSKRYTRFEMQVVVIQSDLSTYCEEPEDLSDFKKWELGFVLEEREEEIGNLLVGENGVMEEVYGKVVPSVVDRETFWKRYFYRVYKLRQVEDARANLVKRAISGEEEDLSWDVDDDDSNNGYEAKNISSGFNEEKKDIEESEVQKSDVVDREITDRTPAPAVGDNAADEKIQLEQNTNRPELDREVVVTKSDEKSLPAGKSDHGEYSNAGGSDLPVEASKPSVTEEEDVEWDEIEDLGSNDDKKVSVAGSPNRTELRKRLSAVEDEEDLNWDIEDEDEPIKK